LGDLLAVDAERRSSNQKAARAHGDVVGIKGFFTSGNATYQQQPPCWATRLDGWQQGTSVQAAIRRDARASPRASRTGANFFHRQLSRWRHAV